MKDKIISVLQDVRNSELNKMEYWKRPEYKRLGGEAIIWEIEKKIIKIDQMIEWLNES